MSESSSYTPKQSKYLTLAELLLTYPIYPYANATRESLDLLLEYKEFDDMISLNLHRKANNSDITHEEHQEFLCTYILLILESEGISK